MRRFIKKVVFFQICVFLVILLSSLFLYAENERLGSVYFIPVDDEITFGLSGFVKRGINEAREAQAEIIVLGIDTFGGRVDASLDIGRSVQEAGDIPIYAYIEDKAWSAGALIALFSEKIIMQKGSSIGSAAPVSGEGEELSEKHISAIRAKFKSAAEMNGYPENIAMAMVDKDVEVRQVQINGLRRYLTPQEIEGLPDSPESIELGELVSPKGKLLNLSFRDAEKFDLTDAIVLGKEEMLAFIGADPDGVKNLSRNWAERLASVLTGAIISSLLMTFGFIFILVEFQEPGLGWPALLGIACFALLFFGQHVVHLAEWTDLLIFGVGVLLILLELFIIPDFGLTGLIGAGLIVVSLYFALSPYDVPRHPWDFDTLQATLIMIMGSLIASIAGSLALAHHMHRIPGMSKLVLLSTLRDNKTSQSEGGEEKSEVVVGQEGYVLTALRPVGRVRFGQKIFDCVSHYEFIDKGEKVEIVEIGDNRVVVQKKEML